MSNDFDVAPQHTLGMTGAQGLHCRFLRGKPACKMNRGNFPARAIGDFAVRKDPAQKALAVPLDRVSNSIDVGGVQPEPDNVRHGPPA